MTQGTHVLQVFHLQQANIECDYLSGTGGWDAQRAVLDRLREPAPSVRILFVTPEKIARSDTACWTASSSTRPTASATGATCGACASLPRAQHAPIVVRQSSTHLQLKF
jgi:hypothetical protein